MIYLMQSHNKLKIGYSNNVQKRLRTFLTGNPDITLLSFKPGTKQDETNLHKLCKDWHVTNEWYLDTPEVHEIFNKYDSWHGLQFEQLKADVNYYSGKGFWKIICPITPIFIIPSLLDYKDLLKESDFIPDDVLEYIQYAENLMELYTIACWFYLPEFDLPINLKWRRKYKINKNLEYEVPYEELYESAVLKLNNEIDQIQQLHNRSKFITDLISKLDKNYDLSVDFKEYVNSILNFDNTKIRNSEIMLERLTHAIEYIKKNLSEF